MARITKKMLQDELKRVVNKLSETQYALLEKIVQDGNVELECGHPIVAAEVISEKLLIWCECGTFECEYKAPFDLIR